MTSAFGKTQRQGKTVPDIRWFIDRIEANQIEYINKEKSTAWFAGTGADLAVDRKLIDALSDYIMSDKIRKVKTEDDLIAARKNNLTQYSLSSAIDKELNKTSKP